METPITEVNDLIKEGAQLKAFIATSTERLRTINERLATAAEYKDGSKTGHLFGAGYQVKISLRDNVKWDQAKIAQLIAHLPNAKECFKTEYKPDNKKLDAAIARSEELEQAVNWARTVSPGAPTVTYEMVDEKF
jgi:restriction endonuclease S subunit